MNHIVFFATIGDDLSKLGVDWQHFIAQMISFLAVAGLLYRFAYKPILQVLEERKKKIAEGLANAQKIKAELAKTEAARQEVLNQANLQANKLIDEARNRTAGGSDGCQSHRQDPDAPGPAVLFGIIGPPTRSTLFPYTPSFPR